MQRRRPCPRCHQLGRPVGHRTLSAMLTDSARSRLPSNPLSFCASETCPVVYYGDRTAAEFGTDDLLVPVFQKCTDPARLVCYCFAHSVRRLVDEVTSTGASDVPRAIAERCRAGLSDCERRNPAGSCCLANVRKVIHAAQAGTPAQETQSMHDAAGHTPQALVQRRAGEVAAKAGLLASAGAIGASLLASACCWLPLALIGIGASAVGVARFFEAYRPHLLGATALLLAAGFYYVYGRRPRCAPGEACAVANPRLQRLNQLSLWVATALAASFATFPNYVSVFFSHDESRAAAAVEPVDATVTRTYGVDGMTCEGCTAHIQTAVRAVPGVSAVEVSYSDRSATVVFAWGSADDLAVLRAIEGTGYRAHRRTAGAAPAR